MKFEIVPAHDLSLGEQARIINDAFAGYVGGWTDMNAETFARFIYLQGTDLFYSRFIRADGELVGFCYFSRTADVPRCTGMGIVPAARGSGAAGYLLDRVLEEAKERGDRAMILEVIQQNPRAHALYRGRGFAEIDQLLGWRRAADLPLPGGEWPHVEEIDVLEALRTPNAQEYPQLPWQVTRHCAAKLPVARAYRAGEVCLLLGDPAATPWRVQAFFSGSPNEWRWEQLRDLLGAVISQFPQVEFFANSVFPAEFGDRIFAPLGFVQEPISQFLMRREISRPA
jgi:GNAT superfamily N-acetyltransferase